MHIADGEPLRFKATFEILPEIEVSGYQELRIEKPDTAVTDQEMDEIWQAVADGTPVDIRP